MSCLGNTYSSTSSGSRLETMGTLHNSRMPNSLPRCAGSVLSFLLPMPMVHCTVSACAAAVRLATLPNFLCGVVPSLAAQHIEKCMTAKPQTRHCRGGLAPAPYLQLALAALDKVGEALSKLIIVGALRVLQAAIAVAHLYMSAADPQQHSMIYCRQYPTSNTIPQNACPRAAKLPSHCGTMRLL